MKSILVKTILGVVAITVVATFFFLGNTTDVSNDNVYILEESKEYIYWSDVIDKNGPEEGYNIFKDFFEELYLTQHNASHIFGVLLYEKNKASGVAICDPTFSFGCYHGFFTAAISDMGLDVIPSLDKECDKSTECQHGIGHGAMEYMGSNVTKALIACEMTDQPDPLAGCTSGVFMEYNVPLVVADYLLRVEPRELDASKPYGVCGDIPERFKNSCYHELGQWWIQVYGADYKTIGRLCENIDVELYRQSCFFGIGNVIPSSSSHNAEVAIKYCEKMPTYEGVRNCKIRASWAFQESPKEPLDALSICDSLEELDKIYCITKEDLE